MFYGSIRGCGTSRQTSRLVRFPGVPALPPTLTHTPSHPHSLTPTRSRPALALPLAHGLEVFLFCNIGDKGGRLARPRKRRLPRLRKRTLPHTPTRTPTPTQTPLALSPAHARSSPLDPAADATAARRKKARFPCENRAGRTLTTPRESVGVSQLRLRVTPVVLGAVERIFRRILAAARHRWRWRRSSPDEQGVEAVESV